MSKTFSITQWSTRADRPDSTHVKVVVIDEVAPGIGQRTEYEFDLDARHDNFTPELQADVLSRLQAAGLLPAVLPSAPVPTTED